MGEILSFESALAAAAEKPGGSHVLLGNGFSIACRPDCFTYTALLDEADFAKASVDARELFQILGTADFEQVIESLRVASDVLMLYDTTGASESLVKQLQADIETVREALAVVLAKQAPRSPACPE